jgi:trehalose 6-phosphate synthase
MDGYVPVNRQFAHALQDPSSTPPNSVVMLHDYHFYLVPSMVRPARPDLFLHFFTHIPWPDAKGWRVLPRHMQDRIFRGLLGSDIVGFQTQRCAQNFLEGCDNLGCKVDYRHSSVTHDGREVAVRHYPISIDPGALRALANAPAATRRRRELASRRCERMILRVDRTDPAKNIVRGFQAYARLLERHPHVRGSVSFVALLQPSRQDIPEYASYMREICRVVGEVNERFGSDHWRPIELHLGEDLPLALAAYTVFDVLMVNSVADGMNLVAKEALVVNENDGVLALSESTGAHQELGPLALTLDPFDIEQQADALYRALTMPRPERRARLNLGRDIVEENDLARWLQLQLDDIELMRTASQPAVR